MRVTCYKDDPYNVLFTFEKELNHEIGLTEDDLFFAHIKVHKRFHHAKTCRRLCMVLDEILQGENNEKNVYFLL